ncbi:hypothetical protein M413DRAFT_419914 [Hebeloma cylindrosporum]|uniref:Uncharacterized protein n=1 Tax=Hebeloma cylindrosporum TaxID=76867 RepID=A0A0C3C5Q4_HEBCY|nr:hypothetical protein M413DRAFT_419914 [Hebeloma cylindrosporum h7]
MYSQDADAHGVLQKREKHREVPRRERSRKHGNRSPLGQSLNERHRSEQAETAAEVQNRTAPNYPATPLEARLGLGPREGGAMRMRTGWGGERTHLDQYFCLQYQALYSL